MHYFGLLKKLSYYRFRLITAVLLIEFFASGGQLLAQDTDIKLEADYSIAVSNGDLPFWFSANTWGLVQQNASYQHIAGLRSEFPLITNSNGFSLSAGKELAGRTGDTGSTLHFRQLYMSAEWLGFRLSAGRFYDIRGIQIDPLSMGSMTQGRNAVPIPKIKFETKDFTDIPFTNGLLQFHLQYSDGLLEENRVVKSPFIHQKSLHLKINIANVEVIGGIDHNVMWAGSNEEFGQLPNRINDYFRVVFSRAGTLESGATVSQTMNRLGNTIGGYDAGINYKTGNGKIRLYRTFIVEDRPGWRFRSPWDGLWGVGFIRDNPGSHIVDAILYEHMNTMTQDAAGHVPKGRASYYNHGEYATGWTYYGNLLSNPMFDFNSETGRVSNNMVLAHHLAITGSAAPRWEYFAMVNYSRNYGVCIDRVVSERPSCGLNVTQPIPDDFEILPRSDFRQDRYSFMLRTDYLLSESDNIYLNLSLALDTGDYSGNRAGVMAGIKWKGLF